MRREQDLGAGQSRGARVLDDIVVVAGQHADAAALWRVEHRVPVAIGEKLTHELVQLAMERPCAVRHGDDVAVVQVVIVSALDQAGSDRHPVLRREAQELLRARSIRDRFGETLDLLARELPRVPVAGEAHLWKSDDLDIRSSRFGDEVMHSPEIVRLVTRGVLELDRCYTNVAHTL